MNLAILNFSWGGEGGGGMGEREGIIFFENIFFPCEGECVVDECECEKEQHLLGVP